MGEMMMTVVWSERADNDAMEILNYLGSTAGIRIARKIVSRIYAKPKILVRNPRAGARELSLDHLDKEFRYLVEGHYKIIYSIDDNDQAVIVSTIFDCRQDPEALK